MLKDIVEKGVYSFHEKFDNWEDAIRAACKPLEEKGFISTDYAGYIISNVHEFGPYIVIAPEICIPHAQEGRGVHDTVIGFMNCQEAVDFGSESDYQPRLFFVLASTDSDKHLENLSALVSLLDDEAIVQSLIEARSAEDLLAIG